MIWIRWEDDEWQSRPSADRQQAAVCWKEWRIRESNMEVPNDDEPDSFASTLPNISLVIKLRAMI